MTFFCGKQPGVAPVFLFSNTKTRLARSRSGSKKLDHRCCLTRIGRQQITPLSQLWQGCQGTLLQRAFSSAVDSWSSPVSGFNTNQNLKCLLSQTLQRFVLNCKLFCWHAHTL